jgi:hypothetical protein
MALSLLPKLLRLTLAFGALALCSASALAQASLFSQPHDQKPGSILFYNKYTSNPNSPQSQDTQINITNTNQTRSIDVHLFFIDGSTCTPADAFLTLTPNQTGSFLASDFDPGVQGYIVAVAVHGSAPALFNYLVGDLLIRESSGFLANLPAVSFSRLCADDVTPNGDGTASLNFNGIDYDRMPASVAVSSFNSQVTHSTNLAIYSPSDDLITGNSNTLSIFAVIYDDHEKPFSASFRINCFTQMPLSSIRVLQGGLNNVVPAGRTGWIRLSASGHPLLGAVLTRGPVFNGGHNFHHLTFLDSYTILIPSF